MAIFRAIYEVDAADKTQAVYTVQNTSWDSQKMPEMKRGHILGFKCSYKGISTKAKKCRVEIVGTRIYQDCGSLAEARRYIKMRKDAGLFKGKTLKIVDGWRR